MEHFARRWGRPARQQPTEPRPATRVTYVFFQSSMEHWQDWLDWLDESQWSREIEAAWGIPRGGEELRPAKDQGSQVQLRAFLIF